MRRAVLFAFLFVAMVIGFFLLFYLTSSSVPIGYYRPAKGLILQNRIREGVYESSFGALPIQNPVSFDIAFGELVPWQNNTMSNGVEFLILDNEVIRANEDGQVMFIRSDRAWRTTHIDIENGFIDGHRYTTTFEYVGNIKVRPGDEIRRGQIIGQGFQGRGALYFEIQQDGIPISPIRKPQ
jgi:hypothetical protein